MKKKLTIALSVIVLFILAVVTFLGCYGLDYENRVLGDIKYSSSYYSEDMLIKKPKYDSSLYDTENIPGRYLVFWEAGVYCSTSEFEIDDIEVEYAFFIDFESIVHQHTYLIERIETYVCKFSDVVNGKILDYAWKSSIDYAEIKVDKNFQSVKIPREIFTERSERISIILKLCHSDPQYDYFPASARLYYKKNYDGKIIMKYTDFMLFNWIGFDNCGVKIE